MNGTEWLVVLGGAAAIAWVNWYFFLAQRSSGAAVATAGGAAPTSAGATPAPAEATITVDGGYSPALVRVKVGETVRLAFERKDTSGCSEEVVFPDFGVRKFLPTGRRTVIEVTPPKAGTYEFMCGMSMLRGRLIAEE